MSTNTFYESYFSCNVGTVSKIVRRSQATPDSLAYLRQRQQILRRSLVIQFVFPLSFCVCTVICTVRVFVCTVSNHIHCDMYRARIRVHGI